MEPGSFVAEHNVHTCAILDGIKERPNNCPQRWLEQKTAHSSMVPSARIPDLPHGRQHLHSNELLHSRVSHSHPKIKHAFLTIPKQHDRPHCSRSLHHPRHHHRDQPLQPTQNAPTTRSLHRENPLRAPARQLPLDANSEDGALAHHSHHQHHRRRNLRCNRPDDTNQLQNPREALDA